MCPILVQFLTILPLVFYTTKAKTAEDYVIKSLSDIKKEQLALATDINERLWQEHEAYDNLLKNLELKQQELEANMSYISNETLLELQHLMQGPITNLQLLLDQDVQKQQAATEAQYMQLLIDIKIALRDNKDKCSYKAIDLHSKTQNFIFNLAYIALQKPEFHLPVYSCDVVKKLPDDCSKVKPFKSGTKLLEIDDQIVELPCDNEQVGGGWTIILKRFNGKEFFHNRTKEEYINGFGDFCQEFFVGIQTIQMMLGKSINYLLRIELTDFNSKTAVAHYDGIRLMNVIWANTTTDHLEWLGTYRGNAGDALTSAVGSELTKPQRLSNIFGVYRPAGTPADEENMMWATFSNESLQSLRLLLRLRKLGIPELT